jgi:TonB family protein
LVALVVGTVLQGQQANPEPYKIGQGVTPPSVIQKVDLSYSPEALEAGLQGIVVLSLVVQPDGQATDLSVVKSLGLGLDERAIEAVRKWRFRPGTKDRQAVPVIGTVELDFRLPASRQMGRASPAEHIRDADFHPPDVIWLELKPGKYEIATTTEWDIPLKLSDLLSAWGPLPLTPEQRGMLDSAKPVNTKTKRTCMTATSVNRFYYLPQTADSSCRRTIVVSTSTKREMQEECGPNGNTTDWSTSFEAGGPDSFTGSRRATITRDGFKMDSKIMVKAKWLSADCTDSN